MNLYNEAQKCITLRKSAECFLKHLPLMGKNKGDFKKNEGDFK